jgi:Protein of unknown function (DUF998)
VELRRPASLVAAATGLVGGALMAVGVAALPHPWTTGYVSQAGAPGAANATYYRGGVLLLAITLVLLGLVLLGPATSRLVLIAGGVLATVSSQVTCTANCPLPPYEHSTAQDLVHAATSIGAIGLSTLAMLLIAVIDKDRLARVSFAICAPIELALAVTLLAVGRSEITAVLERVALLAVLGWTVVCALRGVGPRLRGL